MPESIDFAFEIRYNLLITFFKDDSAATAFSPRE